MERNSPSASPSPSSRCGDSPCRAADDGRRSRAPVIASLAFGTLHLFLDTLTARLWSASTVPLIGWTVYLMSWYMLRDIFIYWALVGILQAAWYQRSLRERELHEARLRADLASARLSALQARLEPHFLFNALNTAVMIVRGDDRERAVEILLELAELLRSVVENAPEGTVPLCQEMELRRSLPGPRRGPVSRPADDQPRSGPLGSAARVPFLILQPLVENALRHGIGRRPGPALLRVRASRDGSQLRLEVADTGPGPDPEALRRTGLGLAQVRSRLGELYGTAASLELGTNADGETLSVVTLPFTEGPPVPVGAPDGLAIGARPVVEF